MSKHETIRQTSPVEAQNIKSLRSPVILIISNGVSLRLIPSDQHFLLEHDGILLLEG